MFEIIFTRLFDKNKYSYPSHPSVRDTTYVKVFVQPQIFLKSIDKWLWNFTHLSTIMNPTCIQNEITLSSILAELCPFFDLKFTFKFAYHLEYFQVHWHMVLKHDCEARLFTIMSPTCKQEDVTLSTILTELCSFWTYKLC
jgi:hypothetical protein